MARITYSVTATEPWEAASVLAKVLDLTVNPLTVRTGSWSPRTRTTPRSSDS